MPAAGGSVAEMAPLRDQPVLFRRGIGPDDLALLRRAGHRKGEGSGGGVAGADVPDHGLRVPSLTTIESLPLRCFLDARRTAARRSVAYLPDHDPLQRTLGHSWLSFRVRREFVRVGASVLTSAETAENAQLVRRQAQSRGH